MSAVSKKFLQDLENHEFTDCTFVFKINGCAKSIVAHKVYLAIASPVFNATFFGALKETGPIEIPDISFEAFQKMIWIIYGKTDISVASSTEACQLYYAAQKYDLAGPLAVARSYMMENMSKSTASEFYKTAILHDDDVLIAKCCADKFEKTFNTTKFYGFFDSTYPVRGTQIFSVVESEEGKALKATIGKYKDEMKKNNMLDMDGTISKTLELIRILTSEAKKTFESIVPESEAKFECSLNWIPPTSTLEAFTAACINPSIIAKCAHGHLLDFKDLEYTCDTCDSYFYPRYPDTSSVISKYGKKNISAYTLQDLKLMYEILKDFLEKLAWYHS